MKRNVRKFQFKNTDNYVLTKETYGPIDSPIYKKHGKKYIKITSGIDYRYLILPEHSESAEPQINVTCTEMWDDEWNRLVEKTKFQTMEQRKLASDEYLKMKTVKQMEVDARKQEMDNAMLNAEKTRKLNPLEKEYEYKRQYTLDRSKRLQLDEEDEMKEFNTLVAMKKCIATWDAQILEKEKIKAERKLEKLEEEKLAEKKRREGIKDDEITRGKEAAGRQNFVKALGEQILEREHNLKLQRELKQLERNKFNKAAKQSEVEELKEFQQKFVDNQKVREEQRRVNELLQRLRAIDKEEDRLFHEKQQETVGEIQKELEQMEEVKKKIELKRKEELQKMADEKVKLEEEMKFKELMEEVLRMDNIERTWRIKETIELKEKQKRLEEMYNQLEKQVNVRRMAKAQVIEEERREVCKVAKENIEDETKEREAERKIKLANEEQRMEILMQINEIDRRKILVREDRKLESDFNKIKEERRKEEAKTAMWRRIAEVQNDGLPKKYVADIEMFITEKYGPKSTET